MAKSIFYGVAILSVIINIAFSTSPTTPVFMWTNTNAFQAHNIQEISVVSPQQINDALNHKENTISKYFTKDSEQTELIVALVEPKVSSEQVPLLAHSYQSKPNGGAFSNLKRYVETSKSSIVLPYTSVASEGVATNLINSLSSSIKGSVYTVGKSTVAKSTQMSLADLTDKLSGNSWAPLNNGITDLLVIYFASPSVDSMVDDSSVHDRYQSDDVTLGQVVDSLISLNYLAIFTSDVTSADSSVRSQKRDNEAATLQEFEKAYRQTQGTLYFTYWPGPIIQGLIVMLPFLGILLFGVCCTFQLQSDFKFDAERTFLRRQ